MIGLRFTLFQKEIILFNGMYAVSKRIKFTYALSNELPLQLSILFKSPTTVRTMFSAVAPYSIAQHNVSNTFPNTQNQSDALMNSVSNINTVPNVISPVIPSPIVSNTPSVISTNIKKPHWWSPSEQEMMQTLSYTSDVQQMPTTYYIPTSPSDAMTHYRSDQWSPYGYPESGYPVIPPNANYQIGVSSKYMAIALFIGLLTLFAIIQTSLMTPEQQDILTNDAKIRCIQRTICVENRQLIKDYGVKGIKLAKYLTHNVKKSLKNASGWDRLVEDAGAAGLRGENCHVLYRDCVLPVISQTHRRKKERIKCV